MKKIILALPFLLFATTAFARDVNVSGYTKSNGTYVAPYTRSAPDNTVTNNYSYQGNTNPNTGEKGHNRYEHDATSHYYTGPDKNGNVGHDESRDSNYNQGYYR